MEKNSESYQVKLAHCTSEESNNKQCIKIGKETHAYLKVFQFNTNKTCLAEEVVFASILNSAGDRVDEF